MKSKNNIFDLRECNSSIKFIYTIFKRQERFLYFKRLLFNSVSLRYDLPVVLTVKDISKILQISIYEVDELINTGLIKTIPLLKENRIFTNHFMEFINSTNTLFENSDGEYV